MEVPLVALEIYTLSLFAVSIQNSPTAVVVGAVAFAVHFPTPAPRDVTSLICPAIPDQLIVEIPSISKSIPASLTTAFSSL